MLALSYVLIQFASRFTKINDSLVVKQTKRQILGIVVFTHSNSKFLIDSANELYKLGYYVLLPYPNNKYVSDHQLYLNNSNEYDNNHYVYGEVKGKIKRIVAKGITNIIICTVYYIFYTYL